MARRRKRFGEVKLRNRGAKRERLVQRLGGGSRSKRVRIKVFVARGDTRGGGVGIPSYYAWACPVSGGGGLHRRGLRCGPEASGRTPTRAVEAALVALAKSHALRKGGR